MRFPTRLNWKSLGILCLVATAFLINIPQPTQANSYSESSSQNKQTEGQVPGRQRGGGQFGTCPEMKVPLTALVDSEAVAESGSSITYVGGVTVSENPTLWFYIPPELRDNLAARFVLQNTNIETVYEISSVDSGTMQSDGIIGIPMPNLQLGQVYQWYFLVYCDPADQEVPVYVHGGIRRNQPDPQLISQLAGLSLLQQSELYQQNQLFYDAASVLGDLRRAQPSDAAVEAAWDKLMQAIEVDIP